METGRVNLEDDEKRLMKRADETAENIEQSGIVFNQKPLEDYLNTIAQRLLPAGSKENNLDIKIFVINEPTLNAFAMPNGRIYLHSGIVAASANEDQLATLIGHEMTHILHRHSLKQFRNLQNQSALWQVFALPAAFATGGISSIIGPLSLVSSITGYSRESEKEADEYGFELTKNAGYDIRESKKMFEMLDLFMKDEKEKEPFFFSSHPHVQERIKNYDELIKSATQTNVTPTLTENYKTLIREVLLLNTTLCLEKGMFMTAQRNVDKLVLDYPDDKYGYYLKGELYRERQDTEKKKKDRPKEDDYKLALEAYDKALAIDSQYAVALKGKAQVIYAQGDKEKAKEFFKSYLTADPNAKDKAFIQRLIE